MLVLFVFDFNLVKSYDIVGCDNQVNWHELDTDLQPATIVF